MFTYSCPHCDEEMKGSFGDNVYCKNCDKTFQTDCELINEETGWSGWLTGKEENGKIDVEDDN